jgi:hypothetical protein
VRKRSRGAHADWLALHHGGADSCGLPGACRVAESCHAGANQARAGLRVLSDDGSDVGAHAYLRVLRYDGAERCISHCTRRATRRSKATWVATAEGPIWPLCSGRPGVTDSRRTLACWYLSSSSQRIVARPARVAKLVAPMRTWVVDRPTSWRRSWARCSFAHGDVGSNGRGTFTLASRHVFNDDGADSDGSWQRRTVTHCYALRVARPDLGLRNPAPQAS